MILSDFVSVALGHKSLMNDFYHLSASAIDEFGIEERFLRPIYLVSELDADKYVQTQAPSTWLFECFDEPGDLGGTGAGRYIAWAERQETRRKKQSGARQTWSEALRAQGGSLWYHPKARAHQATFALRKGISRQHAPFVFDPPAVVDQRLYVLTPSMPEVDAATVLAYLMSSLFALALEVNADLGLGAGVLTLSTNSLRGLPCIDFARLAESRAAKTIGPARDELLATRPPRVQEYLHCKPLRKLDESILRALGWDPKRAVEVEEEVTRLASVRVGLAEARRRAEAETEDVNVGFVASGIARYLRGWLSGRRFPEDYLGDGPRSGVSLPNGPCVGYTDVMLGTCHLRITNSDGSVLLDLDAGVGVAEVIIRSLQLGRRKFEVSTEESKAHAALQALDGVIEEFAYELDEAIVGAGVGARYEPDVRREVLSRLGVNLRDLERDFGAQRRWSIPSV